MVGIQLFDGHIGNDCTHLTIHNITHQKLFFAVFTSLTPHSLTRFCKPRVVHKTNYYSKPPPLGWRTFVTCASSGVFYSIPPLAQRIGLKKS